MAERRFEMLESPLDVTMSGTGLIEAGAGTGKTWTIAALVLRLILERELEIGQILVVTYTRAATSELRGRIRQRLVDALAVLDGQGTGDEYLQKLLAGHGTPQARNRLRLAIECFDEAAIFTIHGFCQRALAEGAFAAAQPFEREMVTEQEALLTEVACNAWRRAMHGADERWTRCLIATFGGPEGLVRQVRGHLARYDAALDAPAAVDLPAAERAVVTAFASALTLWREEAASMQTWMTNARLRKNVYPDAKITAAFAAGDTFINTGDPFAPMQGFELLSGIRVTKNLTKESPRVEHACFAAIDALLQAHERLSDGLDRAARHFLHDFLLTARTELAATKRRIGQQAYDDLLVDLATALRSAGGDALVSSLRTRYRAVLVDEFQDTDRQQLEIFTQAFAHPDGLLVFVGDPKQAIYGFRGADVFAYLAARERAGHGYALLENYRSVPDLLSAVNHLFERPLPFLLEDLPFVPALPAVKDHVRPELPGLEAPLTCWTIPGRDDSKPVAKESALDQVATAVAGDIARLLASAAAGQGKIGERALVGGDIAVLVRKHRQGEAVRAALAAHGIASVSMGGGSVWCSDEAVEIERFLLAVAAPGREGLVRAALATVLLGRDAAELVRLSGDEDGWEHCLENFIDDRLLLREQGFMAMWYRLLRRENVVARMLARPDGERRMTNYRHLAELLQVAEHEAALDVEGLVRHLQRQRESAENEENQLRLESDARLVRIVTIHASKGLQYPVVYCPFLWDGGKADNNSWPVLGHVHDATDDNGPYACLDFGSESIADLRQAADAEAAAEDLRLAYVALTRAEYRCVIAWGRINQFERSPLAWLLFGPREKVAGDARAFLAEKLQRMDMASLQAELEGFVAGAGGGGSVVPLPAVAEDIRIPDSNILAGQAVARPFDITIPSGWRYYSFSSLAARLESEAQPDHDPVSSPVAVPPAPTFTDIASFPRGTRAGSCLHAFLERIDYALPDSFNSAAIVALEEHGYDSRWQPALARMAANVLAASLDGKDLCLKRITRAERLVELEFSFPLDSAAGRAGYMKGFIDLVFRHEGRWYIVDWKSNWLGSSNAEYGMAEMGQAVRRHRYDMQMRIYAAALKRMLAWREPGTDWASGFGGIYYLFLRGMGPGSSNGIHFCRPEDQEIDAWLEGVPR